MKRIVFFAGLPALVALGSCVAPATTVQGQLEIRPGKVLNLVEDSGAVHEVDGGESGFRTSARVSLVPESTTPEHVVFDLNLGSSNGARKLTYRLRLPAEGLRVLSYEGDRKVLVIAPEESGQIHSITVIGGREWGHRNGFVTLVGPRLVFRHGGEDVAVFRMYDRNYILHSELSR